MSKKQHNHAASLIEQAQNHQSNRYKSSTIYNSYLSSSRVTKQLNVSPAVRSLLAAAADKLNLSARSYFKVIKVARTIADIENQPDILPEHIGEALQYRASIGS